MKKGILFTIITVMLLGGCSSNSSPSLSISSTSNSSSVSSETNYRENVKEVDKVVTDELKACFDFFYETANTDEDSPAYGLIPDRYNVARDYDPNGMASIASVGFGLACLPIGVENEWITEEQGYERALKTIDKFLSNEQNFSGFFYHFMKYNDATRYDNKVEVSIIDTAILICGALTAGKYFGGECEEKAYELYGNVDWSWYYDDSATHRFYMGFSPEKGFSGSWDQYGEQLMVYVLAAGSPVEENRVGKGAYNVMRNSSTLSGTDPDYDPFYLTYTGSIFTYQFSHAFIDFRNIVDAKDVNWFDNSVNATKAAIKYAVQNKNKFKTYSENSWGFTACDGPNGYSGKYGSLPNTSRQTLLDGTVPPCGAIGSIAFTPEQSIAAMKHYKENDKLWSKYGFIDAYNLGPTDDNVNNVDYSIVEKTKNGGWYAEDVIGIDKGVSALMIENYMSSMIWNIFMDIEYIQNGLENLGFTSRV